MQSLNPSSFNLIWHVELPCLVSQLLESNKVYAKMTALPTLAGIVGMLLGLAVAMEGLAMLGVAGQWVEMSMLH